MALEPHSGQLPAGDQSMEEPEGPVIALDDVVLPVGTPFASYEMHLQVQIKQGVMPGEKKKYVAEMSHLLFDKLVEAAKTTDDPHLQKLGDPGPGYGISEFKAYNNGHGWNLVVNVRDLATAIALALRLEGFEGSLVAEPGVSAAQVAGCAPNAVSCTYVLKPLPYRDTAVGQALAERFSLLKLSAKGITVAAVQEAFKGITKCGQVWAGVKRFGRIDTGFTHGAHHCKGEEPATDMLVWVEDLRVGVPFSIDVPFTPKLGAPRQVVGFSFSFPEGQMARLFAFHPYEPHGRKRDREDGP